MKHPHSGIVLAWTELQSQGDAFGWVSEGCLRHVSARSLNEKSLGNQWSRLQLKPGIVRDVTITENIKINQKKFRLTLRGPGRGDKKFMCSPRNTGNINFSLWLTGGLSQGCPDFQKVYVFKVYVTFSCPTIRFLKHQRSKTALRESPYDLEASLWLGLSFRFPSCICVVWREAPFTEKRPGIQWMNFNEGFVW